MSNSEEHSVRKAEELVKDEAAHALELFEDTRDESLSKVAEERTIVAAEHAEDVLEQAVQEHGGAPTRLEVREMREMDKIIDAEHRAMADADKNDLFFEDRKLIHSEELAADALEREEELKEHRHRSHTSHHHSHSKQ